VSREVSGIGGPIRAGIALAMVLIIAASAAPAGAVQLGNPNSSYNDTDYGIACDTAPACLWMQTKIPGQVTRAPFNGVITGWRFTEPAGGETGQLVVMRKAKHGKFTAIRASDPETTPDPGTFAFDTHLKAKKGDYIALYSHQAMAQENPNSQLKIFDSTLALGQPKKPDATFPDTYFYTATLKH
jgi:hypothetical protein